MQPPSQLSLVIPSASPDNEFDGRQKTDLLRLRKHRDIEQNLRDMAKSAQTVRDAMVGEKPSEDSHEQAFIEYEERMAGLSASGVRSSIAHRYIPEHGSTTLPMSDFQRSLSHAGDKETKLET